MKKFICILTIGILLLACSCSAKGIKIISTQKAADSTLSALVKDALSDAAGIDLLQEFNPSSSYRKEIIKDDENGTSDINYYDSGTLVCTDYVGYGEDSFKLYKKAGSGGDLTITMVDNESKRSDVTIECKRDGEVCYSLSVNSPKHKKLARNDSFSITVSRKEHGMPVYNYYESSDGNLVHISSHYFDADGDYCIWEHSFGDEVTKLIEKTDDSPNLNGKAELIPEILGMKDFSHARILLGSENKFFWSGDTESRRWYFSGSIMLLFSSKEQCDAFAASLGSDVNEKKCSIDGKEYFAVSTRCLLDITEASCDDFSSVTDFITSEFNDPTLYTVKFDSSGKITNISESLYIENLETE